MLSKRVGERQSGERDQRQRVGRRRSMDVGAEVCRERVTHVLGGIGQRTDTVGIMSALLSPPAWERNITFIVHA